MTTTNPTIQPILSRLAPLKPYLVKTWAFLCALWRVLRPVLPIVGAALLLCLQAVSMVFLAVLGGIGDAGKANSSERQRVTRREMGER